MSYKKAGMLNFGILNLTLKAPITTSADDIHKHFFHCFSEKIRLGVSSESHEKSSFTFFERYK